MVHCPKNKFIIKWYEYDAEKLYKEQHNIVDEEPAKEAPSAVAAADSAVASNNPDINDEVSRILANFANAKQDAVDKLFM